MPARAACHGQEKDIETRSSLAGTTYLPLLRSKYATISTDAPPVMRAATRFCGG